MGEGWGEGGALCRIAYNGPMFTLIKIGLLLLIVLIITGYLAYRAITGKLKKFVTKVVVQAQPAEIHLIRDREMEWQDPQAVAAQVRDLRAAGFRTVTAYRIEELEDFHLVGLAHPEEGWAAAVYEHDKAGVWCDLVAEYPDGCSLTASSAKQGGEQPQPPGYDKLYLKKAPVPRLLRAFQKRLGDRPVAAVGAAEFARAAERSYAREMAWRRGQELAGEEPEIERDPQLDRRCEPLFAAIAGGEHQRLRQLLEADIEPEGRDAGGRTPLIAAAAAGNLPMVQEILEAGGDVNARAPGNPGQAATERGPSMATIADDIDDPQARQLMKGIGQLVGDGKTRALNVTALSAATESGNGEIVSVLIGAGADLFGHGDLTPLQFAAQQGDPDVVRALLDGGAAPDQPGEDDWTPLISAAFEGYPEIVRLLIDAGADPDCKSGKDTAIIIAAESGHREIVDMLSPLSKAKFSKKAEKLIAEGIAITNPAAKRLMTAASNGVAPMVEKLLATGLHPDTLESDDPEAEHPTPLIMAAQGGHVAIVRTLLAAGAKVDSELCGDTALTRATGPPTFMDPADQRETIRVLVTAGASLEPLGEESRSQVLEIMAELHGTVQAT